MTTEDFKRKLTAILSADVEGYSRLMGEDEDSTVRTLKAYRKLMSSLIERFNGRVVDSPGDNLLAEFESVRDAVQCAVEIQDELRIKNIELPVSRQMKFRIGINLGDVIHDEDRIYGDGINVASRVESLAVGGGISISGAVYDAIKNKLSMNYEFQGEHSVKNIKDPVRVYHVILDSKTADKIVEGKKIGSSKSLIKNIAIVVFIIITGLLIWRFYPIQPEEQAPKTIAVLPFEDLSPEKDQEHFVLGLSEEILNSLTQIPDLTVIARTSSFSFKGKDKTIQEIANELGADHILEGSVRKYGDAIRITAQLIKADDESHLWSETYDKELDVKEIYAVQEDIANSVADKFKLTLDAFQLLGGTKDVKAYELYLIAKGQYFDGDIDRAVESIDAAIALDPEFALALVLKCVVYGLKAGTLPPDQVRLLVEEINEATQRAIDLAPNLGKAWFQLAGMERQGNLIEAEKLYQKGVELTTDSIDYFEYGLTGHYWSVGYLEKCKKLLGEMKNKDPLHPLVFANYMLVLGYLGDVQSAEEEYKRGKVIFGDDWGFGLPEIFITLVRLASKDVLSINDRSEFPPWASVLSIVTENIESPEKGLMELRRLYSSDNDLSYHNLQIIAISAAYFGDHELSMDAWGKTTGSGVFSWHPVMKETRRLPRFKEWARKIGLVEYWKKYGWPDLCRPIGDDDFECD